MCEFRISSTPRRWADENVHSKTSILHNVTRFKTVSKVSVSWWILRNTYYHNLNLKIYIWQWGIWTSQSRDSSHNPRVLVCVCIAAARGARFQIHSGGPGGTAQRPQFAQYARSEAASWSVAGWHCVYRRRRDGRSDDRLQAKVFGTA